MYLKSIEVHGFKSFANKIVFQFHNGITGIVGPNGSGKSNVADAVRWVLGEQRIKQLRGASMQDVIFSGTEMRKPLSYAYVAITLDNSDHKLAIDFEEVTIARRIYRSGESEYLINGSVCRLKDVNELFYDTGIGKEGYSIIGQGQIDKILSGKPEERRELFDEAAGIVKFKRRKAASLTKLENEKQNLVRVNDILSELEKQTGPLEKQSETAKIFLKKKEDLKKLDINVFLVENKYRTDQLASVEEKTAIANDELSKTRKEYEDFKNSYEEILNEIETLDKKIESEREKISDGGLIRGKLEGQIEVLKEQINSANKSAEHLEARKASLEKSIAGKNAEKEKILGEQSENHEETKKIMEEAKKINDSLFTVQAKIAALNEEIEEKKNAIIDELNNRAQIKGRIERFDTIIEQNAIKRAELNSRLLRAKSDEEAREEDIKKFEEEFEVFEKEIEGLKAEEDKADEELNHTREKMAEVDASYREQQEKYHLEKSKLEALVNISERYEGYGSSVQHVMEKKQTEDGIVGVVADIIKVEKKYETAIEVALGANIQNVVTKDVETAKRLISFLKVNKFGRVTFLPLTSITDPQKFKNNESLKEKGAIGLASELVTVDKEYINVAKAMLGRILVVDNIDNAVKIAKKYDQGIRMVTLEGELIVPGGAISGGAYKNSSNLLGRNREIEELTKKIDVLKKDLDESNRVIDDLKSKRNKLRLTIESLKSDIQRKVIEQNTARLNIEQAKNRMAEELEGTMGLKKEENELALVLSNAKKDKEDAKNSLTESEKTESEINERILVLQKELSEKRAEESDISANAGDCDLKLQKVNQQNLFIKSNIDRIDEDIARINEELEEILETLKETLTAAEEKKTDIDSIKDTITRSKQDQTDAEENLSKDIERRDALNLEQKSFIPKNDELSGRLAALDKEIFRLNSQKEKIDEAIENQINYMWEEYELTLNDAFKLRDEELTDLNRMKKEISGIKDDIKKLGPVNVNAIEEYKNLMERYTFLKGQHDDLVEAEKTLENIIEELDTAMRKQFTEKFALISKEYDSVFKELFGGGKATLELMEDEDILEAGIRIIAQPPGKKLQNMMQLSGGEKALSAIALLFAIQNLKPSPFCLLDEIEAALDDSNVTRFAKYLHKLTKHTQFIVITHRRGTMEQVDCLYGITMQEKGVSTLVSVNLIDKELDD
ncbi:MAG: chromosome segregation protein SMC [Lachnospiraceae bacterium]|nr:chromosome segregation protein SMC [Lachnospiraceae bacterium]